MEKTTGKDGKIRTTTPKKPKINVAEELEANRERIDRALKLPGEPPDSYRAKWAGVDVKTLKAARDREGLPLPLKFALDAFRALTDDQQARFLHIIEAERLSGKSKSAIQLAADRAEAMATSRQQATNVAAE